MKNYKDLLQEASDLMKLAKGKEFSDSGDATEVMEGISSLLKSKSLKTWAGFTDDNYGLKTSAQLKKAIAAYDSFLEMMYSADEM